MIRLYVFDLDGTILNTMPDLAAAMKNALLQGCYPPLTEAQAASYIGNGIRMFAKRALPEGATDFEIDETVKRFKIYYAAHLYDNTFPYDGISELLDRFKAKGIRLAVLSNKYFEATDILIKRFFPGVFDVVLGESADVPRKPDVTGFMKICKSVGVNPCDAAMIGDSPTDLKTALAAGAIPVSVTWGYRSKQQLADAGAVNFASDTGELERLLLSI